MALGSLPSMRTLGLLALLLASGCATSISTLQTGKALRRGQVQVATGVGVFIPAGQLLGALQAGYDSRDILLDSVRRDQVSAEERAILERRLMTAGLALAVAPPGVDYELSLRAGLLDRPDLDLGLRYAGGALRLDAKYRIFHRGDPASVPDYKRRSFDVALGLGLSRHSFDSPALKVLELVRIDDFSRHDVEVPVYVSADVGGIVTFYAAPKYIYGRTSVDQRLVDYAARGTETTGRALGVPRHVNSHFAGSSGGVAVGYRYVQLFAEITAGYIFSNAHVLGEDRQLGGFTVYPALGIAFRNGAGASAHP